MKFAHGIFARSQLQHARPPAMDQPVAGVADHRLHHDLTAIQLGILDQFGAAMVGSVGDPHLQRVDRLGLRPLAHRQLERAEAGELVAGPAEITDPPEGALQTRAARSRRSAAICRWRRNCRNNRRRSSRDRCGAGGRWRSRRSRRRDRARCRACGRSCWRCPAAAARTRNHARRNNRPWRIASHRRRPQSPSVTRPRPRAGHIHPSAWDDAPHAPFRSSRPPPAACGRPRGTTCAPSANGR